MRRLLLFVLCGSGLVLLALGGQGIYLAASNSRRIEMSCDAFARGRPDALWLRLTDCELDYLGAGYHESGGRISELFFPVRSLGRPRSEPAPLVAATRDPAVLALAEDTMGGSRQPEQEQYLVMMLRIVTALHAAREIEGYRRAGAVHALRSRRQLSGMTAPLVPDVAVIDLHSPPDFRGPGALAASGTAMMLAAVFFIRRRATAAPARADVLTAMVSERDEEASVSSRHYVENVETSAKDTGPPGRLHGVMLLNLPPDAGYEAIEDAPPLGTRAEVADAIDAVFPFVVFGADGRGTFARDEDLVTFDIGRYDPVPTVVLDARGGTAIADVMTLLRTTGWRAFAPRDGVFVAVERLPEHAASSQQRRPDRPSVATGGRR
jgi:hypothetical protein